MRAGAHPRRARILAAALTLVGLVGALVCSAPALGQAAPSAGIAYRTFFQDPGTDPAPDFSLERHAIDLIDATPPGARITFTLRDFSRAEVAGALIAAHQRGVQVDGVVDGDERNRLVVRQLRDALGSHLTICGSPTFALFSCIADTPYPFDPTISTRSLQHNKFMTFSALTDGRRHVVLQTSENFYWPTQYHYYNDMVEIAGDQALHDAYVAYALDMHAQRRTSNRYVLAATGDDGRNTIFPSPRLQPDVDTDDIIVDRLNEIDCAGGGSIHVAQMSFRRQRAVIMRKLLSLKDAGCDIEVIVSNTDGNILAGLVASGIPVHPFFVRAAATKGGRAIMVHDKFWLVDARSTLTGRRSKIVYAGSSNWRADQQYSDDLLLRVIDDGVYDAYLGYWRLIRERAQTDPVRPTTDALAPSAALGVHPRPNPAGWHRSAVDVRVAASDGFNLNPDPIGLGRLQVTLTGALAGTYEAHGEQDGYSVIDVPVTEEGVTTVEYFAEDAFGNRGPTHSQVIRVDRTPPALGGLGGDCVLWPPRGDLRQAAAVWASDGGSGLDRLTVSASSTEPAADPDDIVVRATPADVAGGPSGSTVVLRASKASRGRERTYRIVAEATDIAGNATAATAECVVPHSMGRPTR